MTITKCVPKSLSVTATLLVALLTVLAAGCEAVGPAGQETKQAQALEQQAASADSITIVNEASETVFVSDDFFVMLKGYYVIDERSGYSAVGSVISTWEELKGGSFTVEFEDADLDMEEDYWQ